MGMNPRLLRPLSSQFDPRTISSLVGWWDASDASTITTISGAVSAWASKAGATRTLTQSTAANRPLLTSNYYSGRSAVAFDGSNDSLFATNLETFNTSPISVGVAVEQEFPANRNDGGIVVLRNSNVSTSYNNGGGLNLSANGLPSGQAGRRAMLAVNRASSGGYDVAVAQLQTDQPVGKRFYFLTADGTNATLFDNGTQVDQRAASVSTVANGVYFGCFVESNVPSLFWTGKILEVVLYNRAINSSERTLLTQYICSKWGIS